MNLNAKLELYRFSVIEISHLHVTGCDVRYEPPHLLVGCENVKMAQYLLVEVEIVFLF